MIVFIEHGNLKENSALNIKQARKLIREGSLKARIILNREGKPYEYIFLKKENTHLVDPDRYSSSRKSYERYRNKSNDKHKHNPYTK